jgi:hypothetical protein
LEHLPAISGDPLCNVTEVSSPLLLYLRGISWPDPGAVLLGCILLCFASIPITFLLGLPVFLCRFLAKKFFHFFSHLYVFVSFQAKFFKAFVKKLPGN